MTSSEGRRILHEAYSFDGVRRTFAEHVDAIASYAAFNVPPVWNDQWGVEEISLSHYLFSFQPLNMASTDMLTFKTTETNPIIYRLWTAVHSVFAPYVHTLAERSGGVDAERVAITGGDFEYKYNGPVARGKAWRFVDQEEVRGSREVFAALEGEAQIVELIWQFEPALPRRGGYLSGVYTSAVPP